MGATDRKNHSAHFSLSFPTVTAIHCHCHNHVAFAGDADHILLMADKLQRWITAVALVCVYDWRMNAMSGQALTISYSLAQGWIAPALLYIGNIIEVENGTK